MSRPVLYVAITNHGFGHATRAASVVAEIQKLNPDILVAMVTTAPRWLLESYVHDDFLHRPRGLDVGVIQSDSITMDKAATLEKLQQIQANARSLIASEVNFIQQNRARLILADIPPLAAPIAKAAGIPCWMMSNFGWDFIYGAWGDEFAKSVAWIRDCFQQCDRLFRLPFHEPMSAFSHITDVGLTGGSPRYSPEDLRSTFEITTPPERTILLTFGGLNLDRIPYQNLERFPNWQFITFDRQAPQLPNLVQINDPQYRPVDVMPLCGRMVSKPGYSTFAEACRLGLPIVSITRDDFAESHVLLAGIQDHAHHQILTPDEFFHGNWDFLHQAPKPPRTSTTAATDGNQAIAQAVVDYFQSL